MIHQARTIENQIDVKLVQLSKLGNGIGSAASSSQPSPPSTSDKTPLLDADSGEEVVEDSSPAYKFKVRNYSRSKFLIYYKEQQFLFINGVLKIQH